MQYASSSSQRTEQATNQKNPRDTKTTATEAGVFGLSAPAPVCGDVTTLDVQRAKVLNKRVIGDWQLRVPVTWLEATKPEDGTSVGFFSRLVDYSLRFFQVEGCRDARTVINGMKHRVIW